MSGTLPDAGHFEEEGREAVDKIATKATIEKLEPMELVQKYTNLFHWAMEQFNNLPPSIEPTATGHIVEQISMIQDLIKAGYAYEQNGSVYFDVKKYAEGHDYGKLSGRVIDDLLETTRDLEGQEEKKNKTDFALWKAAPPEHIMRWKSPWGEGFPRLAHRVLGHEHQIPRKKNLISMAAGWTFCSRIMKVRSLKALSAIMWRRFVIGSITI
jgi:cysteinyl-tRNA synthetase